MPTIQKASVPPNHHFFGYYGINPWDRTGRYHLALETDFNDRRPEPSDKADVGVVDSSTGKFVRYGSTKAFNFQQGSMLNWIDAGHGEEFTFNDWEGERLVSRAVRFSDGSTRTIDGAIAAVSPDRRTAIGLNFARMARCREVVGYASTHYPLEIEKHPLDDGLFLIHLETGERKLLLPIAEVIKADPMSQVFEGPAWLDHVVFNPEGSRLFFFCRIKTGLRWHSSFWTVNTDGTGLRCQIDYRYWISHFAWRDEKRILVTTDLLGSKGFVEFTDCGNDFHTLGKDVLPQDGHMCFSPDGAWLLSDMFAATGTTRTGTLLLYNLDSGKRIDIANFVHPKIFSGDIRCDLHPRWAPDGTKVTFDSVHEDSRQIYTANVETTQPRRFNGKS